MEKLNFATTLTLLHQLSEIMYNTSAEPERHNDKSIEAAEAIEKVKVAKLYNSLVDDLYALKFSAEDQLKIDLEEKAPDVKVKDAPVVEKINTDVKVIQHPASAPKVETDTAATANFSEEAAKLKADMEADVEPSAEHESVDTNDDTPEEDPSANVATEVMALIKKALNANNGKIKVNDALAIKARMREIFKSIHPEHECLVDHKQLDTTYLQFINETKREMKEERVSGPKEEEVSGGEPNVSSTETQDVSTAPASEEQAGTTTVTDVKENEDGSNQEKETQTESVTETVENTTPLSEAEKLKQEMQKDTTESNSSVTDIAEAIDENASVVNENISETTESEPEPTTEEPKGNKTLGAVEEDIEKCAESETPWKDITSIMARVFVDLFDKQRNATIDGIYVPFNTWAYKTIRDFNNKHQSGKDMPVSNNKIKKQVDAWERDWKKEQTT